MTTFLTTSTTPSSGTPVDRVLTASLVAAPVIYLLADGLYAARGWADPAAGVLQVLGSVAFTFVMLWVVARSGGWFAVALLVAGALGVAGNVAYGFDTIHVSLGDTALVDAPGAANLIKPLGLFFPLMVLLCAVALRRTAAASWAPVAVGVGALVFPVAHIANIGWLAVAGDLLLLAGFAAAAFSGSRTEATAVG
jgi:hypothetical protein